MTRKTIPWAIALFVMLMAMFARYVLIQPPDYAHQCEASPDTIGCAIRTVVIYTYAWYGLGYAALALSVVSLLSRSLWIACGTLAVGFAALVLYCYEPGAFAVVIGVLRLARIQTAQGDPAGHPARASET